MSWDVFVQDLPADAESVEDIPNEFRPQTIGDRQHIIDAIKAGPPRRGNRVTTPFYQPPASLAGKASDRILPVVTDGEFS